jgi:hypothetical protein
LKDCKKIVKSVRPDPEPRTRRLAVEYERDFNHLMTDTTKHGFSDAEWEAAKAEGKAVLAQRAGANRLISYTDFMHQIHSISFETPYDSRLPHLLAEISTEEAKEGRGMMTALVVRKNGDQKPGRGFFELAERIGYVVSDPEKFWIEQVNKVFVSWQKDDNR